MRLRQPEALPPYKGMYYAQSFGKSCPQQKFTIPSVVRRKRDRQDISDVLNLMYGGLVPDEEDCKAYVTFPARVELNSSPRPDHKRREAFKCHTFIQSPCRRCKYHHTFSCSMSFIQAVSNSVDIWWCLPNWWNLHVCPHYLLLITSCKKLSPQIRWWKYSLSVNRSGSTNNLCQHELSVGFIYSFYALQF